MPMTKEGVVTCDPSPKAKVKSTTCPVILACDINHDEPFPTLTPNISPHDFIMIEPAYTLKIPTILYYSVASMYIGIETYNGASYTIVVFVFFPMSECTAW